MYAHLKTVKNPRIVRRKVQNRDNVAIPTTQMLSSRIHDPVILLQAQRLYGNRYAQQAVDLSRLEHSSIDVSSGAKQAICRACSGKLGNHDNSSITLQRQEEFTASTGGEVSRPDTSPNLERLRQLMELQTRIATQSARSVGLRNQLDALQESSLERNRLEAILRASREILIELLEDRIKLLQEEITSLNVRIGPNPMSSPGHPETSELGHELLRREQERRQHQQQLHPLKRWQMRRQIGSLNEQIAAIERELATLPQTCDPLDPTAELLLGRKSELERRKQAVAKELTSTATEYEQWDPRWGAKRYGKSSNCTNIQQAGCGPTSLAIVLNYLYQEDPESLAAHGTMEIVTPVETASYAATHGRVCNSGTAGDTMVTNVHTGWPGFRGQKITLMQATTALRNGELIIFLCKSCTGKNASGGSKSYGGHFMVLNGVNETGAIYNVLDPGANEAKDISTISRTELEQHTGGFWVVERM